MYKVVDVVVSDVNVFHQNDTKFHVCILYCSLQDARVEACFPVFAVPMLTSACTERLPGIPLVTLRLLSHRAQSR